MMMGAGHFLFFVTPFLAENDHGQRWRKENTPFLPSLFPFFLPLLLQYLAAKHARSLLFSLSLSLSQLSRAVY
jgi:hypothetical protein